MKRFLDKITDRLADAAVLEMGIQIARPVVKAGEVRETLEDNLVEVAFAEAADYDDIHKAILKEHESERDIVRPDECQYGDNDLCYRHAA